MSSMETINEEIQPIPRPRPIGAKAGETVFIGFAATITVGLALAGWYVGGRIFAAEKVMRGDCETCRVPSHRAQ